MSGMPRAIERRRDRLRPEVLAWLPRSRRLRRLTLFALALVVGCAAAFALGRGLSSIGQPALPVWSPADALPRATIKAEQSSAPSIAGLPAARQRPRSRRSRGQALTRSPSVGTTSQRAASVVPAGSSSPPSAGFTPSASTAPGAPTTPSGQATPIGPTTRSAPSTPSTPRMPTRPTTPSEPTPSAPTTPSAPSRAPAPAPATGGAGASEQGSSGESSSGSFASSG